MPLVNQVRTAAIHLIRFLINFTKLVEVQGSSFLCALHLLLLLGQLGFLLFPILGDLALCALELVCLILIEALL